MVIAVSLVDHYYHEIEDEHGVNVDMDPVWVYAVQMDRRVERVCLSKSWENLTAQEKHYAVTHIFFGRHLVQLMEETLDKNIIGFDWWYADQVKYDPEGEEQESQD